MSLAPPSLQWLLESLLNPASPVLFGLYCLVILMAGAWVGIGAMFKWLERRLEAKK